MHRGADFGAVSILAGVVAGITALVSVFLLMRWFKGHEGKGFTPFAIYCVAVGAASLVILNLR